MGPGPRGPGLRGSSESRTLAPSPADPQAAAQRARSRWRQPGRSVQTQCRIGGVRWGSGATTPASQVRERRHHAGQSGGEGNIGNIGSKGNIGNIGNNGNNGSNGSNGNKGNNGNIWNVSIFLPEAAMAALSMLPSGAAIPNAMFPASFQATQSRDSNVSFHRPKTPLRRNKRGFFRTCFLAWNIRLPTLLLTQQFFTPTKTLRNTTK